jgi:hypothetical protein
MNSECDECIALARELSDAYAEAVADENVKTYLTAVDQMIKGEWTEAVEEYIAECCAKRLTWLDYQPSRAGRAVLAAWAHRANSGHKLPLRLP